ncbi:hypothetical protein [Actinosynnema sp. NPDC023587]|uniref:hypothetical protein n=1 Tax=Actinosynnema sp. NPDC023587 TaxID=3154695 RepID=UPI0033CC30D6
MSVLLLPIPARSPTRLTSSPRAERGEPVDVLDGLPVVVVLEVADGVLVAGAGSAVGVDVHAADRATTAAKAARVARRILVGRRNDRSCYDTKASHFR